LYLRYVLYITNHIAVTCPIIDNGGDPELGSGNCQFSNSAALKNAVDAYTSSPAGTTYTDNGTTKDLTALGAIGTWCTSGITSMSNLFNGKSSFNENINAWDTSSVTKMGLMFKGATVFNQPLDSWDTSSVTTMAAMFFNAAEFNQDISGWNVSSVIATNSMFRNAAVFDQPIQSWDVSSVTNMQCMFCDGASAFNQDISGWTVSSVTDMRKMFRAATAFTQNLCLWKDAPAVTSGTAPGTSDMFLNCPGGEPNDGNNGFAASCVVSVVTSLFDSFFISFFGYSLIAIRLLFIVKTHDLF